MQKFILFFLALFFLASCGQNPTNKNQIHTKDTLKITEDQVTPNIRKVRQEYILSYSKPIEFKSSNKGRNNEKLSVWGKYYCLFDSAIVVPGKYNFDDTTKAFTTHNFAEDIVLVSNGDTILKRTITKKYFLDSLPQYLKDYAIIFEPKFEGYNSDSDTFDFSFSVSIPVTDVGQLMLLSLKRNGQVVIKDAE